MKKIKVVQNCLKWREHWSKKSFGLFTPPPPKKNWRAYKIFLSKMKKIKVVQNCLKWRENWSKTIFGFVGPPPPKKKFGGRTKNFLSKMKKIKVVQNCLKWRENWPKTIFGFFAPPPKKNWKPYKNIFVKNGKNQSCSKLPEMARKLVENDFWTF